MLKNLARKGLQAADDFFAAGAGGSPQSGTLMAVLFHSLCADAGECRDRGLPRDQNVTVEEFRRFVDAVLEAGYTVVSPQQVDGGLKPVSTVPLGRPSSGGSRAGPATEWTAT